MVYKTPVMGRIKREVIGLKPTRGLSTTRLSQLPKERRLALGSLAFLVVLLGSLTLYQRFAVPKASEPSPGVRAPAVPQEEAPGDASEVAGKPDVSTVAPPPQQLMKPLSGRHQTVQAYGMAYSELFGDYRLHSGIDYAAAVGESVLAAGTGKVTRIDDDPVEGRVVELDHGGGMFTRYGGLGEIKVGLNATVQAGTVIGQVAAGETTHLHFEVLVSGAPVDPAPYVKP